MTFPLKKIALAASGLLVSLALAGCQEKGPAEKAGENLDKVGRDIKDSVDPRGPVEKAGAKVDKALDK